MRARTEVSERNTANEPCDRKEECEATNPLLIHGTAGAISFSKLLQTIQDMAEGGERLVNVDEWTWLIVQHYSEIKLRRFEKSHNVSHGTTECGTKKVSERSEP